ncbi:hypothetical protein MJH12_02665, partial [bacterium]|nr:hypothetical protein [bacterium]
KIFYPIQPILFKNRVSSFFGFSKRIIVPTFSSKKGEAQAFGFPTIKEFNIVGFNGSKISYEISGEQLSFQDKKILMFYSPLIKEVQLKFPKIIFHSKKEGKIVCTSNRGLFDQKTVNLLMKNNIKCLQGKNELFVKKLSFDGKKKELTLYVKNIKIHLI